MKQQKLLFEIKKERTKEQKELLSQKYDLRVSRKLGENDTVIINGVHKKIFALIESDPIALWNHIYTKNSKTSLLVNAYAKLKKAVNEANPKLIEDNVKRRNLYYAKRNLNRESSIGILGTPLSQFHKKKP